MARGNTLFARGDNYTLEKFYSFPMSETPKYLRCANVHSPPLESSETLETLTIGLAGQSILNQTFPKLWRLTAEGQRIAALPNAPNLEKLELPYNSLKQLPVNFEKFKKLTRLDLSGNRFTAIPELICELPFLEQLDLTDNLIETIPFAITKLVSLTSLWLPQNRLKCIPPCLEKLPLHSLSVSQNQLNDISLLPQSLVFLACSSNYIPVLPKCMPNLWTLYADNNQLMVVPDYPDLRYLEASKNQILKFSAPLPMLRGLFLQQNSLTDVSILSEMPKLQTIKLSENRLTTFPCLKHANKLTQVDLSGNFIREKPVLQSHVQCNLEGNPIVAQETSPSHKRKLYQI